MMYSRVKLYKHAAVVIIVSALCIMSCAVGRAAGQEPSLAGKERKGFFAGDILQNVIQGVSSLFADVKGYVTEERQAGLQETQPSLYTTFKEVLLIFCVDLVLSLCCLWATLWILVGVRKYNPAPYLWFFAMFNLGWYIVLWCFRGIWYMSSILVFSQQPGLEQVLLGKLTFAAYFLAAILYVWLLARIFQLQLLGAIKAFFISHFFYLLLVFFFIATPYSSEGPGRALKENLTLSTLVHTYVAEVNEIAYGSAMLTTKRIRMFHL